MVLVWVALNLFALKWRWDPYPFILFNLAFSTQSAYPAPHHSAGPESSREPRPRSHSKKIVVTLRQQGRHRVFDPQTGYCTVSIGKVTTREYLHHELKDSRIEPAQPGDGVYRHTKKSRREPRPPIAPLKVTRIMFCTVN
ncbi:membrane protein [Mycobacterium lepromatosis]|nr:membrane protein [Mycobacterium lepromatosis]